ncbi:MAG: NADPH-dependent assimilatory sulfite reductase hemoprotein subunit [Planctomycetales bacterium]|nr:NADPH-dependent assimilatory sulfite reductase hemoprotein subunit [Planctomycetales bacterium]
MSDEVKLSPVEEIKETSQYLRGDIPEELVDGQTGFGKSSVQLLKHHGTYEQEDRDGRAERRANGDKETLNIFMVRTRIPGGKLTSEQLLAELDLCDELGNTTLRATSRQGLQLHGVLKTNLKESIRRINDIQLTTLGACGDVNRNVMCCPAPTAGPIHDQLQKLAAELANHFAPHTSSYHDIWLTDVETGEKTKVTDDVVEPIYGKVYLPRKFKMGIALPDDNCIDIYTHDLGLLAIIRDGQIVGYNMLVGGGQGVTPAIKKTYPALAHRMAFVRPAQVIEVAEAVVKVQRDFGNREDRKQARLKYLIADWGLSAFKAKVEEYVGYPLTACEPDDVTDVDHHMGWREQGDGKWCYGLCVASGRILDNDEMQLKSALRAICRELKPGIRLTAQQSILFADIAEADRSRLEELLRTHHVPLSEQALPVRLLSLACVAWPTCGLSITESERAMPGVLTELEEELTRQGLEDEQITVRMTGCPNGCARPYNCDIGLVGKAKEKYTLYVGGRTAGDRLSYILKDLVPRDELIATLAPVLARFKSERSDGESFGDYCHRVGAEALQALCCG